MAHVAVQSGVNNYPIVLPTAAQAGMGEAVVGCVVAGGELRCLLEQGAGEEEEEGDEEADEEDRSKKNDDRSWAANKEDCWRGAAAGRGIATEETKGEFL